MNDAQKIFIQRQILQLDQQQLSTEDILSRSLSILDDEDSQRAAFDIYKQTGSLIKTLTTIGAIQIDDQLLEVIENQDKKGLIEHRSLLTLLSTNYNISALFRLLKIRLSVGLSYAMWLIVVATFVFSWINLYVYPEFSAFFNDFGAELPHLTQMALDWQNNILSPAVIGIVLLLVLFMILIAIHRLSDNRTKIKLLNYVPFINRVIKLMNDIHWLGRLRILLSSGLTVEQCLEKLNREPHHLKRIIPQLMKELITSERIGTLNAEIEYQIDFLQQQAEKMVTNATRNFMALVMIIIVTYIVFALIASYLPIFQSGALI